MSAASDLARRLRPGLDVNDSSWAILRYPADWRAGDAKSVSYDAGARALALAPLARPELTADWLPLEPVAGPDGALYRTDPERDLLLARAPCTEGFAPVKGIGGHGFATGRFDLPLGLAVAADGRILVADAGNRRVQVIDPSGEVVAILSDGLVRPVHVAVAKSGKIFVADSGSGRVHRFSDRFVPNGSFALASTDPWTGEAWIAPPDPYPLAIAVADDGTIIVFDPMRPALWHRTAAGKPLPALPWPPADAMPAGWSPAARRYAAEGEIILGPIDGGAYNFAWHRVLIDADLPPGTSLTVQTYADNEEAPASKPWAPRAPVAVTGPEPRCSGEFDRLVLPDEEGWERWRIGRLDRDRPDLFRFDGDGPVAADRFTLPAEIARRLQVGDRVAFTTDAGGTTELGIVAADAQAHSVAATGPGEVFAAPASLQLLEREGRLMPYGPLDLGFLVPDPAALGLDALGRSGHPENADLPHDLAAFLEPGDVLGLGAAGVGRIEIIERHAVDVEFVLEQAVEGDFSTSRLTLVESAGRLVVRQPLPDAAEVPPGNPLTVMGDVHAAPAEAVWVDAAHHVIRLAAGALAGSVTAADWSGAQFAESKASDRGRFLWLRLRLRGAPAPSTEPRAATATPLVRALRITGPRPSLLDWMPALFSRRDPLEDAPGANFLERFLALFEGEMTRIESAYESVSRLLNPAAADGQWLDFVASWLDLAFDPSWPIERRRALVREGAALQAAQGTPAALARYLEIYTGARPAISEGFRDRPPAPIQLGARGALGVAPLGNGEPQPDGFAHRFSVSVRLPQGQDRRAARSAVRQIIETMKPAHASYALDTGRGSDGRIGIDGSVGGIVIPGPESADPCACDPDIDDPGPRRGHVDGGFRLGGRLGRGGAIETAVEGG